MKKKLESTSFGLLLRRCSRFSFKKPPRQKYRTFGYWASTNTCHRLSPPQATTSNMCCSELPMQSSLSLYLVTKAEFQRGIVRKASSEACTLRMAVGRGARSLIGPLLTINFVVYLILLGLAGWSLDKYIDGEQDHPHLGGNPSTTFLLTFALIGGVIGLCSLFAGLMHLRAWRSDTLASVSSSAFLSWAVTALAFGLVCKQIILGGHRGKRLQTLEAFVAISTLSQLLYLLLLHAGMFSSRYGPAYGDNTDRTHQHQPFRSASEADN